MTVRWCRTTTLVFAAAVGASCGAQESGTDARLAELEKQLADTQKQLAAQPETPVEQAPAADNRRRNWGTS
jgi:erythromycin esterase-like protein